MKARAVFALLACCASLAAPAAAVEPSGVSADAYLDAIDASGKAAYEAGNYSFCSAPSRPLGPRQRALCPLAQEIEACEGLRRACGESVLTESDWLERLVAWMGPVAQVLLFALVIGIILAIAIPVVRALAKLRRDRRLAAETEPAEGRAAVVESQRRPEHELDDAETALGLANAHRTRGELDRALSLYLAACLVALDRRGAIRLARHRTNGEYVRACTERDAKASLREIVREVDAVEFGGARASVEAVDRVAERARAIVRTAAVALLVILGAGCVPTKPGADPAGDELPIAILERNGFSVARLESSLATMPIPEDDEGAPVVIVDVERVPLEDEARAHMMRWVEAGGALVLFGRVAGWPSELRAEQNDADTRDLVVRIPGPSDVLDEVDEEEEEEDDDVEALGPSLVVEGARTARRHALSWEGAQAIAFLGDRTYAAKKRVGRGVVLGVANADLFTNAGVMPRRNAAALVTLLRAAAYDPFRLASMGRDGFSTLGEIRVARAEDGIPPPSNPFAALVAAGLGKGAWHALAAAAILFLAYGVRHARPRRDVTKARRAFTEHVRATGALYARARAHAHALAAYGRFFELRMREILPRGADPAAFLAARTGVTPERAAELWTRATTAKAGDPLRGDELVIIEELRKMLVAISRDAK